MPGPFLDHVLRRDAELFHDFVAGGGHAESVDAEGHAVEADVLRPRGRHGGFDGDAATAALGQHFFAVLGRLSIEARETRDAHHARSRTELLRGDERMLELPPFLRTGGWDGESRRGLFLRDVAALEDAFMPRFHGDLLEQRHRLSREREERGALGTIESSDVRGRGLLGIRRANDVEVRNHAECRGWSRRGLCVGLSSPTPMLSCVKM